MGWQCPFICVDSRVYSTSIYPKIAVVPNSISTTILHWTCFFSGFWILYQPKCIFQHFPTLIDFHESSILIYTRGFTFILFMKVMIPQMPWHVTGGHYESTHGTINDEQFVRLPSPALHYVLWVRYYVIIRHAIVHPNLRAFVQDQLSHIKKLGDYTQTGGGVQWCSGRINWSW